MKVSVPDLKKEYEIVNEKGAIARFKDFFEFSGKTLIVTDDAVPLKYKKTVAEQCITPRFFTLKHGEESKSVENYIEIMKTLLQNDFKRTDTVIALGGGVCGDIAAFAASTYMRGIKFINIPTTLLAMVDSSVGGKTGIDLLGVKNVIGTFYMPEKVIIDTDVLDTLPKRELNAGLSEAVKMAATCDEKFFGLFEEKENPYDYLTEIVEESNKIKKSIVSADPYEKGLRRVLNFGHTVGHAIEGVKAGELLHGECVAIGMLYMASGEAKKRIREVLKKLDLPVTTDVSTDTLINYIKHDKKAESDFVNVVWCDKIGEYEFRRMTYAEISKLKP